MADRIRRLPDEVLESFESTDPAKRVAKLQEVESEILVGMLPVIGWIERNRPAGAATPIQQRIFLALREAVECAGLDIPQYSGGTIACVTGSPAPGALRTARLSVLSTVTAASLMDWATDIETEPRDHPGSRVGDAADVAHQGSEVDLGTVAKNLIRRCGANWDLRFGDERGLYPVSDYSALGTVAKLVARPHHPFDIKDL